MDKKRVILGIAIILLMLVSVGLIGAKEAKSNGKVDAKVLDKISKEGKARVIVIMKDSGKKSRNNMMMENSIEGIGEEKIGHKFNTINAFSASLSSNEINKLSADVNVEKIYYDRPLSINLQDSVPLINGTNAWKLQSSGVNLTGKGQTICIIDTGIDYTHPDLGNCTPVKLTLNGTVENLTTPVENSPHPYVSNYDNTLTITKIGYSQIAVHFVNISTEYYYDYVEIVDSNNKIVAIYSGSKQDIWSPTVSGDTIYVRLKTDESVTDYGFYIDQVINGTTNTSYDWSNCSKVIGGWDIRNGDPDPKDDQGHGTHVAGIAAANGVARGVAPEAKIIAIKALSSGAGTGTTSDVVAGIEWCVNRSSEFNITVISMSIGGGNSSAYCDENDTLSSTAINAATAKNISVVIAAGNDGWTDKISYPACIQNAIPVGSIRKDDSTVDFNRNWMVQLFAPGYSINSTKNGGGYTSMSGTSMATPHVAGAFAIINQFLKLQGTTKTPQEIESVLNATGKIIPDSGSGLNFSRINIYDAILAADSKNPEVSLIGPSDNYKNNSATELNVTFRCNATDFMMKNITLYVWNSTDIYNLSSIAISGANVIAEFNLTNIAEGEYLWNCIAYDNNGNSAFAPSNNSIVYDITTPNVTLASPAEGYSATGTTTLSFDYNVSDGINLRNCSLILNGAITGYNSSSISKNSTNSISYSLSAGSYTWSINCTDQVGNIGNSSTRSLTINAEPPSNGGGGGGGPSYNIYTASKNDMNKGYTKELKKGDKINFETKSNEAHSLTLNQLGNYANLTIKSNPINFILKIGEVRKLNLTSGKFYDILVKLEGMIGVKANITIKSINEQIEKTERKVEINHNGTAQIETPKKEISEPDNRFNANIINEKENVSAWRNWTDWAICVLVLAVILAFVIYLIVRAKPDRDTRVYHQLR
jgi:subtilisin family serine protease